MRKSEKEPKTEKSVAPVPAGKGGREEASKEKKPRRGRKPKAEKQQEEAGAATPDSSAETRINAATEPENITEPESPVQEPVAEGKNAREEATGESGNTEESVEEPEPEQGITDENVAAPVPVTTASAQIVESPLKQMKKEFQRRSQVIRDEMLNIQNSFVTIGFQLHWIHRNNMFRVLNYKSIYEYAEKECNIKRTTCCNLICIIENYADRNEQGEVIESIADCYRNYSASQLVAMLGMPEDMIQQVSPDMSVRAINRLKKGEPEPGTVETSPAPSEEPAPVKEAVNPAPEEKTVPDDTVHEEEPETEEMQEPESPGTAEEDTAHEEEPEDTGAAQMDDDVRELPEEAVPNENIGTLAEIDSYTDYQSMQDELDLIMRNVFAEDSSVRVKIVCVQG
ncbi:MAG: hypothetical protein K2O59_12735 [Lachnospiraceae bacterium]|nr:hypothetical protein [Lachnospiraceae bacterium]